MKKFVVVLISLLLIVSFVALVYYGLRHARGIPIVAERIERVILEAPLIDKEIDLAKGISLDIWDTFNDKEVKLMYQLMVLPWPKAATPSISVKAFHNQNDIYFYISWQDDTEDRTLGLNKFSDACAILFPLGKEVQPSSLMMGFLGKANIWQWKASQDREYYNRNQKPEHRNQRPEVYSDFYYPFEEEETLLVSKDTPKSAANDLIAIRVGTITPKETQNIAGRGFYSEGIWRVVFKRPLKAVDSEEDAVFNLKGKQLCAFAVWNGAKDDRGGRKSISNWVELVIK